jgi:hypothetical protein
MPKKKKKTKELLEKACILYPRYGAAHSRYGKQYLKVKARSFSFVWKIKLC